LSAQELKHECYTVPSFLILINIKITEQSKLLYLSVISLCWAFCKL